MPGPFRLADTKLTEEDTTSHRGLDNNKASCCWFSIAAQTDHYTLLPASSCGSQVSTNPREETREASRPRKLVTCTHMISHSRRPMRRHERKLRTESSEGQGDRKRDPGRSGRGCEAESAGGRTGRRWGQQEGEEGLSESHSEKEQGYSPKGGDQIFSGPTKDQPRINYS